MENTDLEFERFPTPPIVEAILFIECLPPVVLNDDRVAAFRRAVEEEYPVHESQIPVAGQIAFTPTGGVAVESVTRDTPEHMFRSADEKNLIQLRRQGFAANRLEPYPDWVTFRSNALEAWNVYRRCFAPETVSRIGLRYLNRIFLPLEDFALFEYLRTAPQTAEDLNLPLSGFFMQLVFPERTVPAEGVLTQMVESPATDGASALTLTLDIEVYTKEPESPDTIGGTAERLRTFKNRLFFTSITERTKELFR